MPKNLYIAPPCKAGKLAGAECEQAIQWASVDASLRSAEAAERANYIGVFGAGSSLLALIAAWLAFREARRASNAAEKQAEEAVKSSNLALKGFEISQKYSQKQFEAQAAESRSLLVLNSAKLVVLQDRVVVTLVFEAQGTQGIEDLLVDIVPTFEDGTPGSEVGPEPDFADMSGMGLMIKGNDTVTIEVSEQIDGDAVHAMLEAKWMMACIHIQARWRDALGFVIHERLFAWGNVHARSLARDLSHRFEGKSVSCPAL